MGLRLPFRHLATLVLSIAVMLSLPVSATPAELDISISYLRGNIEHPPVLSNLDPIPANEGLAGAQSGNRDNATTGRFLNQNYALSVFDLDDSGRPVATDPNAGGAISDLIIIDAPADQLLKFADRPENAGRLILNVRSGARRLRDADCRRNVLHTIPSDAMRADALMQFFVLRRWSRLVMIQGRRAPDQAFADALRASATKFGLKIKATKEWISDADLRRTAATELPVFTQGFPKHDVLIVADETGDFARYLPYNTWLPRPIAGSEGLVPTGWSRVVESWGAAQLQSRFTASARRAMRPVDYAAWAAVRAIGEAITRTGHADAGSVRAYLLSDAFQLAGFKGRALSFRAWNGQMRQTIHLVQPRAVVANAPLPGFLHRVSELDTLGIDAPESACRAFAE